MATVRNMSITSTSVSPWQYTLAYTTNHGELHITNPLPTPDNLDRRMKHFVSVWMMLTMATIKDYVSQSSRDYAEFSTAIYAQLPKK